MLTSKSYFVEYYHKELKGFVTGMLSLVDFVCMTQGHTLVCPASAKSAKMKTRKKVICHVCQKLVGNEVGIKLQHVKTHHQRKADVNSNQCLKCGQTFSNQNLLRHLLYSEVSQILRFISL